MRGAQEGKSMKNSVDKKIVVDKFESISIVLLWILIIGMPLHTMLVDKIIGSTFFPFGGLVNLWRDVIILLLFAASVLIYPNRIFRSKLCKCVISGIVVLGVFWIFSDAPFMLKSNILRIYVIPMLMCIIMYTFRMDEALYEKIVLALFAQGVMISAFGLVQVYVLGEEFLTAIGYGTDGQLHHSFYIGGWHGSQRLVGTFASPNNCALYLTQLFVISWVNRKVILERSKWFSLGYLVILVGIVATFSRSSWVSLAAYMVAYFILSDNDKRKLLNWRSLALAVGTIAILLICDFVFLDSLMRNMIVSSVSGVINGTDASFLKHLEDVILPAKTIIHNPLGFGFGNSGPIALATLGEGTRLVESSVWLVGFDTGIIGLVMYFFPYVYTMSGMAKKAPYKQTAGYLAMASLIIFFILPLHENIESTFLIFLFMGLSHNSISTERDKSENRDNGNPVDTGASGMSQMIKKYWNLYATMCNRRDDKLMIFGAWFGKKYDDNPRYLFEYVVHNCPEIKAVWITGDTKIYDRLKEQNLPVCMCDSQESKELARRAKYVFTATGRIDVGEENLQYLGGAHYINLWHGIPLKKIMYDDEYSAISKRDFKFYLRDALEKLPNRHYYVVSTSDVISDIYESAFRVKRSQILQLGQPRNDIFFSDHENMYVSRFQGKNIVLYMPTHRNEGATAMDVSKLFDLERLNTLCKENNTVFLIKKHFYHAGEANVTEPYDSIFDITNEVTETQTLLDAASVLITDYSSCYIDYLLLDRPMIFYNFDAESYEKNDRQLYFNYDDVTPGKKCATYQELESNLVELFGGQDCCVRERADVRNLFYCKEAQGKVSVNIIQSIKKL